MQSTIRCFFDSGVSIRTLRQKLGKYGAYIKTVRNVGYQLEANI